MDKKIIQETEQITFPNVKYEIKDMEDASSEQAPNKGEVKVHRVIDGDTIEAYINGVKESIRLIGLDTPEIDTFDYKGQELYGEEAKLKTLWELQGETITIEIDVIDRDVYGRVQAWIWYEDKLFNEYLIQNGLAYLDTFIPNIQHQDRLIEAQQKAREAKAGLWAVDFFSHPPEEEFGLDLTNTILEIDYPNIDQVIEHNQEKYVNIRRRGLGATDIPIILGANPFKQPQQLIREKLSRGITEEEKAVGKKPAVRKGRDLEPLVLHKLKEFYKGNIWKPDHMYRLKDYEYIKINFDGVTGDREQYLPVEIKTITFFGEKYYNPKLAYYDEFDGFRNTPNDISGQKMSIEDKGEYYGIPPMYYVQLQVQMLGLGAPYGHIATLGEKDWTIRIYHIWKDEELQNQIIVQAFKFWQKILNTRGESYDEWRTKQQRPLSFIRGHTENDV